MDITSTSPHKGKATHDVLPKPSLLFFVVSDALESEDLLTGVSLVCFRSLLYLPSVRHVLPSGLFPPPFPPFISSFYIWGCLLLSFFLVVSISLRFLLFCFHLSTFFSILCSATSFLLLFYSSLPFRRFFFVYR